MLKSKKIKNELMQEYDLVMVDKDDNDIYNMFLCWAGGQSHTIQVFNNEKRVIALSTFNHKKNYLSKKEVKNYMKNKIKNGSYNWI